MKKPNIVYLFFDELRCDALSCYEDAPAGIRTPNIDRIAERGVLFKECYCNSPVCVPSRYSILTGLYPETTGVYHNEAAWEGYEVEKQFLTIPEVLEKNGYATANFGKQHLPRGIAPFGLHDKSGGNLPPDEVKDIGKDIFACKGLTAPIGGVYPADIPYPPALVTKHAIDWMEQQTEPFMVRLSYLQPHTPVVVPEPFASMYDGLEFPEWECEDAVLSRFENAFAEAVDCSNLTDRQRYLAKVRYYGLVAWLDTQVGEVLQYLSQSGQLEDTILLLGADHGAMLGENRRYGKQNFYFHSHRVPLLISWPAKVPSGTVKEAVCENISLGKTLFQLLGISCPEQFQGMDLLGEQNPHYVFGTIGYGERDSFAFPNKKWGNYDDGRGWPMRACIRSQRFRLDMNIRLDGHKADPGEEDIFFTDRRKDKEEQYNMAELPEYQDIVGKLRRELLKHIETERVRAGGEKC